MDRRLFNLILLTVSVPAFSQTYTRQNIATTFGFENGIPGQYPAGWGGGPLNTIVTDNQVAHSGKYSGRITRDGSSAQAFSTLTASLPLDFAGHSIQWRGWIKTQNVNGYAALWCREDGDVTYGLAFDSEPSGLNGTNDWAQFTCTLPVQPAATLIYFGFLLSGTGTAWVDDLELLVDGVEIGQIPYPIATDHQFDSGSQIQLGSLSPAQIQNLYVLAKVWGFLKYVHPAVTGGLHQWDYDLFRIMPQVIAAPDSATALGAISAWVNGLEPVGSCAPQCASLTTGDLALGPNTGWIADTSLLGPDLSATLQNIFANRRQAARQFYVSRAPSVLNPSFDNEPAYPNIRFADAGYQLLALFRYWNMVEYFYPNRAIMSNDAANDPNYWDEVLQQYIPAVALAPNFNAYQLEMMEFIAQINDTHANLWSSISVRPPSGPCQLPVDVRFVEGSALVLRWKSATAGPASLQPGDIIQQLGGVAVSDLVTQWTPVYADSNQAARLRDMAYSLTQGPCGPVSVVVQRGSQQLSLNPSRVAEGGLDYSATYTDDLPGAVFQMLSSDVAYLKLSSVLAAQSANYIQQAAGTKGLIIDIRNYPSEFVVFTLGDLLVSQPTNFAWFTQMDAANPGAFHWGAVVQLTPTLPHYSGRVVILVDEVTQSQAEYTTMAFRSVPGAIVVGSTTAGADGNVSTVTLPGNLSSYFSGLGTFYPDRRPTQRVGIIPDVWVTPTIAGMRAGRDELVEKAMQLIEDGWAPHRVVTRQAN